MAAVTGRMLIRLWGVTDVQILDGHALPDDALQTGEADAELVLQQLAHAAQAAVAQMVDVVGGADAHGQAVQIVDGGHDIVHGDVLGDQVVHPVARWRPSSSSSPAYGLQQLLQDREMQTFSLMPHLLGVKVHEVRHIHHVVGEDLDVWCRPRPRQPR